MVIIPALPSFVLSFFGWSTKNEFRMASSFSSDSEVKDCYEKECDMNEKKKEKWIQDAIKSPGSLRKSLKKKEGEKITKSEIEDEMSKLKKKDKDPKKKGVQGLSKSDLKKFRKLNLAKTLKGLKESHSETDNYMFFANLSNMKHINNFEKFNEGKLFQFIFNGILSGLSFLENTIKRIKGTYVPMKHKDKTIGKRAIKNTIKLLDHSLWDTIRYQLSKDVRSDMKKYGFIKYVEYKMGYNLNEILKQLKEDMSFDKLVQVPGKEKEQKKIWEQSMKVINDLESAIRKLEDEIIEDKDLDRQFKELSEELTKIDPRIMANLMKDKDEVLSDYDDISSTLSDMKSPKHIDDILDKIKQTGINSLTDKEKSDLEIWSKKTLKV